MKIGDHVLVMFRVSGGIGRAVVHHLGENGFGWLIDGYDSEISGAASFEEEGIWWAHADTPEANAFRAAVALRT